ncbi:MAG: hypothetical protein EXR72_07010 [Myxococcales bacterium]|nr:hypothetical protein [Myxococcales bacterium]
MIVEDRTTESAEEARDRKVLGAGMLVAHRAFAMCEGDPAMTLRVLAAALGTAIAHSGAPLDEIFAFVETQRDAAAKATIDLIRPLARPAAA